MSDPPSYDRDLLSRLNALKKTNIQLEPSFGSSLPTTQKENTPEVNLSERLRSLRNGGTLLPPSAGTTQPVTERPPSKHYSTGSLAGADGPDPFSLDDVDDDKTLDELLAGIGSDNEWLNPNPDDVHKLLDEAKDALRRNATDSEGGPADNPEEKHAGSDILTSGLDMSVFKVDDEREQEDEADAKGNRDLETESREIQDIVAKFLDEVNIEARESANITSEDVSEKEVPPSQNVSTGAVNDTPSFKLPSPPSKVPDPQPPSPSRKSIDFESDISARLAALKGLGSTNSLGLPSAPTTKPVVKESESVTGSKGLKKFTDEEIDSWCIICQDDATVECVGCDGDLYCARCWKEGHMGPDADFDSKRHQWRKYLKPR